MMVVTIRAMHMFMMLMLPFIQALADELINDLIQLVILFPPDHHDLDLLPQMGEQWVSTLPKTVYRLGFSHLVKTLQQTGNERYVVLLVVVHQVQIEHDMFLRVKKHIAYGKNRGSPLLMFERFGKKKRCNI